MIRCESYCEFPTTDLSYNGAVLVRRAGACTIMRRSSISIIVDLLSRLHSQKNNNTTDFKSFENKVSAAKRTANYLITVERSQPKLVRLLDRLSRLPLYTCE